VIEDSTEANQSSTGALSEVEKTAAADKRFREIFGVSKDELRAAGVDPGVYARENVKSVLATSHGQAMLPISSQRRHKYFVYAERVYVCLFAALFFLLLTGMHALAFGRTALFALSWASLAAALVFAGLQISTARRYRRACKEEGIRPHLLLKPRLFPKR
jgi:hypothetical protein